MLRLPSTHREEASRAVLLLRMALLPSAPSAAEGRRRGNVSLRGRRGVTPA